MQISGRHVLARSREDLFQRLLDPALLVECIPGCEELVQDGPHSYRARLSVGFGPIKGTFTGSVQLTDLAPPQGYTMHLKGEGKAGFLSGLTRIELVPLDGGRTEVRYQSDLQVGGLIATVGSRFIPGVARGLSEQFFTRLERALQADRR
jgi:carbon monoxide dehydrogenase subunit G